MRTFSLRHRKKTHPVYRVSVAYKDGSRRTDLATGLPEIHAEVIHYQTADGTDVLITTASATTVTAELLS